MTGTRIVVGIVGLGVMGGRAGTALREAGHEVIGFDVAADARARAEAAGVEIVSSADEVARRAPTVLLSLPGPADSRRVASEIAPSGTPVLVADLSTIDPASAREAAATLTAGGHRYVDAPVLGRPAGVGSWTLPVGGADEDVDRLRELAVGSLAKAVERVGDVGAGSAVKVLNNAMFGVINAVTAEVLDLAQRAGLDPARFVEVVADSGAATVSPLFRNVAPRMVTGDHDVTFSLDLLRKDLGLGVGLAREFGTTAEMTVAAEALTAAAADDGYGAQDTSALIELHRRRGTGR